MITLRNIWETLLQILGFLSGIPPLFNPVAKEHFSYFIETSVLVQQELAQDPAHGFIALALELTSNFVPMQSKLDLINGKLDGIISGTDKVTPITPAPAGYGGGGGGASAADVWNYVLPGITAPAGVVLEATIQEFLYQRSFQMAPYVQAPDFFMQAVGPVGTIHIPTVLPTVDWSLLIPADTQISFLTRCYPAFTWVPWAYGADYASAAHIEAPALFGWIFRFNTAEFNALKAAAFTPLHLLPPVWPGIVNVTLGTPVAISPGVTIATPMHGVIIDVTGEPGSANFFDFDGTHSYRNLGALTFGSDDGDYEFAQSLGFVSAVYCPKTMAKAATMKLRATGGVTGTITPWVVT